MELIFSTQTRRMMIACHIIWKVSMTKDRHILHVCWLWHLCMFVTTIKWKQQFMQIHSFSIVFRIKYWSGVNPIDPFGLNDIKIDVVKLNFIMSCTKFDIILAKVGHHVYFLKASIQNASIQTTLISQIRQSRTP